MKRKAILAACLLLVTVLLLCGCAPKKTPYEINDQDNYTFSIKYDANGGLFATNTSVIVDSYNVADLSADGQKPVEIALLPPSDSSRGNDAFEPSNSGYFLAGWYTQRIETKDEVGNITYRYEGKWNFEEDVLTVDPKGDYHSAEPQLTLYAAWVPLYKIEMYALNTGEHLSTLAYDPTEVDQVLLPAWDETTGLLKMNDFPEKEGFTFKGAFYDERGTQPVTTEAVIHPGTVDDATGTASDISMKLYVDYMEGKWYHIHNAEQFEDNASVDGNYILQADLDFTETRWPTKLMNGNFTGTIEGNGHTIKNISLKQNDSSKVNTGIFGNLTEEACIRNVTFDNASLTIQVVARKEGCRYGLFAGTIAEEAVLEGVTITNSSLQIDSKCYFEAKDYSIGLVCGIGSNSKLDHSRITCVPVGDAPEKVNITVNGNTVTLVISE